MKSARNVKEGEEREILQLWEENGVP